MGKPILDALINSGKFNVTVLARETTKAEFPASVKVAHVDFENVDSLTAALKSQDALVSAVGNSGLQGQTFLVDASIAAGVKRFIPSEFGSDLANPKTRAFPIFGYKVSIIKCIEEKARTNPGFTYTNIRNGAFLDWGIEQNFLVDLKSGKPRIYDSGNQLFSSTSLASIGLAVVGVLSHVEETKNRSVYVQDLTTSQNRILEIARKVAPQLKHEPVHVDTDELLKDLNEKTAKGDYSLGTLYQFLHPSLLKEGYGGLMEKTDNELLGIPGDKTDADIEAILRKVLAEQK